MADGALTKSTGDPVRDFAERLRGESPRLIDGWSSRVREGYGPGGDVLIGRAGDAISALLKTVIARLSGEQPDTDGVAGVTRMALARGCSPAELERCLTLLRRTIEEHVSETAGTPSQRLELVRTIDDEIDRIREEVSRTVAEQTQQRLRATEEKRLSLMKNADEAMFLCRPEDLVVVEASRGAELLTGYGASELLGMRFGQLQPPEDAERVTAALGRVVASDTPATIENAYFLRRDEVYTPAFIRAALVQYGDQRALFVAARDTSEARELEEQVRVYADQLKRNVREKSELITALTRVTTAISSGADLDKVFQIVIFEIGKLLDFDFLCIVLIDDFAERYRVASAAGETSGELSHGAIMPFMGSIFETVARDRTAMVVDDLERAAERTEDKILRDQGMRSYACVPLLSSQRAIGGLCLASRMSSAYSSHDTAILNEIADQVAVATECSRLSSIEKRRSAELAIINEVGREAITTLDLRGLLKAAAVSIQKNFAYYDVSIFLVDWKAGEVVLTAQAGAYHDLLSEGYRQRIGVGMVGWCAEHGETIVANDVSREPRRIIAFDGEQTLGSELCVPIMIGGLAEGVINVECRETNVFDESSVGALETLADLVSRAIENALLFQNARSLTEFNESVIAMMPASLLVLDHELRVVLVNAQYCQARSVEKSEVEGRRIAELFDEELLRETDLPAVLERVLKTGERAHLQNIRHRYGPRYEVLNIHMSFIGAGQEPRVVMIMEDVTDTVEHAYRLSMLRQINSAIQSALQLEKILRLVLTCVTAGKGLGFNRAVLLMVNRQDKTLEGWTGIGPRSREEAGQIYARMAAESKSLEEIIAEGDRFKRREDLPLYELALKMVFPLAKESELVVRTVREKRAFLVTDAQNDVRVSQDFRNLLGANEFVSVPIVAKDEVIGAIVADNLYDGHAISEERVELLTIFANHAGLAIENGQAYADLEEKVHQLAEVYETLEQTHDRLLQSEKLAAMGQMAASVAHEIRNPLVSIGGFARSILESVPPENSAHQDAEIIVREVDRLEKILKDTLDFARPPSLKKALASPNAVVDDVCKVVGPEAAQRDIEIQRRLDPDVPEILLDAEQLKQALLNIVKNAIESINWGGRIELSTSLQNQRVRIEVTDTGGGIPDAILRDIFNPFFTTRPEGTGLGLGVTRKIIEDHGGHITVRSKLGVGSTFTVYLPARTSPELPPAG